MDTINLPFVYRKCLLTGLFNNQILSYIETQKILDNCVTLELKGKKVKFFQLLKDITNFMFGNKVSYDIKDWLSNFKSGSYGRFSLNFAAQDGKLPD